jgi:hypothetical protein
MSNDTLSVLGQNKRASYEGDFVFGLDSVSGKGTAVDEGFGHVHKHWYKQTKSYEQGFEELAKGKAETEDIVCSLADMVATVDDTGKFCFKYLDGRLFYPTLHAIQQAGTKFGTGTWYAEQLYNRASKGDGDALAFAFQHGKVMLQAEIIEIIKSIIPGGRLSHWRGDSDTIYGNILIPDSIREEDDSDYGGMVSLSNCEIGIRSMLNLPSVFRAICMNGCIWNQETGKGIKQVHRGKLDLVALKAKITENIEKQIPLLPQGIQRILGIRAFKDDINIKPLVGQLALDYKFGKSQATAIIKAYGEEARQTPQYRGTLFNLVNAVTRAGQTFSNSEWVNADMVGGELVNFDKSDWESLTGRASRLKADVVDELFASAN